MFEWFSENKEWFFSGAGIAIIGGLIAVIRSIISKESLPKDIAKKTESIYQDAWADVDNGYYEAACLKLQKAIKMLPRQKSQGDAMYYELLGRAFMALGKFNEAAEAFTIVLELDPKNTVYLQSRGLCYQLAHRYNEAICDISRAIERGGTPASLHVAYSTRGSAYHELGQLREACDDFTESIKLDPYEAMAYFFRANVFYDLKEWKQAIADYEKALEIGLDGINEREAKKKLRALSHVNYE